MSEETNEKAQEEPFEGSKLQLTRQRDFFKRAAENLQSQVQDLNNENLELKKQSDRIYTNVKAEVHRWVERYDEKVNEIAKLLAERDELKRENENLCSVMIAAAEEIQEHWDAHCDEEGYGPANLMHRLEKGIPADYPGYKFGAFTKMQEEIDSLKQHNQKLQQVIRELKFEGGLTGM